MALLMTSLVICITIGNMTNLDPQLLELSEIIPIIDELFKANEELISFTIKNYKTFDKKYPVGNKNFEITPDVKKSIINILRFAKLIKELKNKTYKEIKKGVFDFSVPENFKQLSDKAFELSKNHVMCFQKQISFTKELPENDRYIVKDLLYVKLYEAVKDEGDVLDVISKGLKKYSKIIIEKTAHKLNTFKLKSLKNSGDVFEDFENDGVITSKKYGCFELSTDNKVIYSNKKTFKLEPQQWKLLQIFLENPNKLLTIEFIVNLLDKLEIIEITSNKKYISKLEKTLKEETGKTWVTNEKEKGWIFNLEK